MILIIIVPFTFTYILLCFLELIVYNRRCAGKTADDAISIITILLNKGTDTNLRAGGLSAILAASHKANVEIMKLLIMHGANVNEIDSQGNSPLLLACQDGNSPVVDLLLSNGASLRSHHKKLSSFIFLASKLLDLSQRNSIMKLLLLCGAKVQEATLFKSENRLLSRRKEPAFLHFINDEYMFIRWPFLMICYCLQQAHSYIDPMSADLLWRFLNIYYIC